MISHNLMAGNSYLRRTCVQAIIVEEGNNHYVRKPKRCLHVGKASFLSEYIYFFS